jgi:hypothetical protein
LSTISPLDWEPNSGRRLALETDVPDGRHGSIPLFSGDAVHFQSNRDNRRVPSINWDKEKTLASMQSIADVMTKEHAKLWINHAVAQRKTLKLAPEFYE